jgi:hypothetical protein
MFCGKTSGFLSAFVKLRKETISFVCILLGISPASDYDLPTFRNSLSVPYSKAGCRVLSTLHPAFEDGTDRGFRNVGKS